MFYLMLVGPLRLHCDSLLETKVVAVDIYLIDLIDFVVSSVRSSGTKKEVEQPWSSQRNPKNLLS